MPPSDHPARSIGFAKSRVESLTDGVFGFAMTLLVVGLVIPDSGSGSVSPPVQAILVALIPDFVHYAIAFFVLAGFWAAHHAQTEKLRFIDRRFLWVNTIALMFVALVPFSTSLAGDYPDIPLAAMVMEGNILILGLIFAAQWRYATTEQRLVSSDLDVAAVAVGMQRNLVVPIISCLGILLALAGITWSTAVYLLVPLGMRIVRSGG